MKLQLDKHASLEAQIASLADDIAYLAHDCEDGILSHLLDATAMEKTDVPLVSEILSQFRKGYAEAPLPCLTHELTRRIIKWAVADLLATTEGRLADLAPKSADDIRGAKSPMAAFSGDMQRRLDDLKKYLRQHFWWHYKVNRTTSRARHMLGELFARYMDEREQKRSLLPPQHRVAAGGDASQLARHIADYIASMTDGEAHMEYTRLFGPVAVMQSLV